MCDEPIATTHPTRRAGAGALRASSRCRRARGARPEDRAAPIDVLGSEDESMTLLEEWATVAPAVRRLPKRERTVLYLRFFRGLTQSEIARDVGVSQMHVSRILAQTLRTLRETVGPADLPAALEDLSNEDDAASAERA